MLSKCIYLHLDRTNCTGPSNLNINKVLHESVSHHIPQHFNSPMPQQNLSSIAWSGSVLFSACTKPCNWVRSHSDSLQRSECDRVNCKHPSSDYNSMHGLEEPKDK